MTTPTVSVVIPTFNRAGSVGTAIESVLAQTWQHFEVIVVDDGSTDDTAKKLSRFGDRIQSISQSNKGVSAARTAGIHSGRGKWVAFLDSDDRWQPTKLERQMQCMRTLNVGMCFTRCLTNKGALLPDIDLHTLRRGDGQ